MSEKMHFHVVNSRRCETNALQAALILENAQVKFHM